MSVQSLRGKVKVNARKAVTQNYIKCLCVTLVLVSVAILLAIFAVVANVLAELFGAQLSFPVPAILKNWSYVLSPAVVLVSLVVEWVLFSALVLGAARWFYRLCGGETCDVIDAFDYFSGAKRYFGSLWMELNLFVRKLLWSFLFLCVPVAVCVFGAAALSGAWMLGELPARAGSVVGAMLVIAGSVLTVIASIFAWIFLKRYALARYLYADDGGCGVRRAIQQSVYFMKGHKNELFLFDLSFLGWFASCVVIVPIFYVAPYYMGARALYARVLIESNQRSQTPSEPTREFDGEPPESEPDI